MDCANNESIYLKECEWEFLLSGIGMTDVYGLFSEKNDVKTRNNRDDILVALYSKHIISCEGKQIIVFPPVSEFLEIMSVAMKCVILRGSDKDYSVKCCYITSTAVLIIEKSQREVNTIRLRQLAKTAWIQEILDAVEENEEMQIFLHDSRNDILHEQILYKEDGLNNYLTIENKKEKIKVEYQSDILKCKMKKWMR